MSARVVEVAVLIAVVAAPVLMVVVAAIPMVIVICRKVFIVSQHHWLVYIYCPRD